MADADFPAPETLKKAPKPEESKASPGFDSSETLGRIDSAEKNIDILGRELRDVKENNRLISIVLMVGLALLLATIAGFVITMMIENHGQLVEQNKEIIQLQDQLKSNKN